MVSKPQGILIAGSPARLAGTVKRSDKYIESGSLTKSPFKYAVDGHVGVNKISTFLKGDFVNDPLSMYLSDLLTVPANLAGLPAISIPCGFDKKGLPVGLQLIGNVLEEGKILNAANIFEIDAQVIRNRTINHIHLITNNWFYAFLLTHLD